MLQGGGGGGGHLAYSSPSSWTWPEIIRAAAEHWDSDVKGKTLGQRICWLSHTQEITGRQHFLENGQSVTQLKQQAEEVRAATGLLFRHLVANSGLDSWKENNYPIIQVPYKLPSQDDFAKALGAIPSDEKPADRVTRVLQSREMRQYATVDSESSTVVFKPAFNLLALEQITHFLDNDPAAVLDRKRLSERSVREFFGKPDLQL